MKRLLFIALLCSFSALHAQTALPTYTISTVAGSLASNIGDGGGAIGAVLVEPRDAVTDAAGNVYIADFGQNRVRKIAVGTGIITTVAGTGRATNSNTAGPGISSGLNQPSGLAIDVTRNILYIASRGAHVVKKLDLATGVLSTLAGTGSSGYNGDGRAANIARLRNPTGVAVNPTTGDVFIADRGNNRIRKVTATATTPIITTVAGIGPQDSGAGAFAGDGGLATKAALNLPDGVAVDKDGNIYIADTNNHRIRMVTASNGIITTIAGTGAQAVGTATTGSTPPIAALPIVDGVTPTQGTLNQPRAVAVTADGDLLIAEAPTPGATGAPGTGSSRIRILERVAATGAPQFASIQTFAGCCLTGNGIQSSTGGSSSDNRQAKATILNGPRGVSVDSAGNVLIVATGDGKVIKVDATNGLTTTVAGNPLFGGDGQLATTALFSQPRGVAVDAAGNVYIADTGNNRVRKVTAATKIVDTIAGAAASGFAGDGGPATAGRLNGPRCLAVDGLGTLYVADTGNHAIRKIDVTGAISTVAGAFVNALGVLTRGDDVGNSALHARLNGPACVAVDSTGTLYIADTGNNVVRSVNTDGTSAIVAGTLGVSGSIGDGGPAIEARLNGPEGVAVSSNLRYLYISEVGNDVVRRVDLTTGIIDTIAGTFGNTGDGGVTAAPVPPATATFTISSGAQMENPIGLATDANGNIFIADSTNNRLLRIDAAGNISRVAGGGDNVFPAAEGGAATAALLQTPRGVATDATGGVYITDTPGGVKKLTPR